MSLCTNCKKVMHSAIITCPNCNFFNSQNSKLLPILLKNKNQAGICILTLLTWVMVVDDSVHENELFFIRKTAQAYGTEHLLDELVSVVQQEDISDIQLACELLNETFKLSEEKKKLIELVIWVLFSDGFVTNTECHVLFFIADLFSVPENELSKIYKSITSMEIPTLGDLSSISWWEKQEAQFFNKNYHRNKDIRDINPRLKHLGILGLDEKATLEDIKKAYKRLAQIHHPDKFHSLGPEAVELANESFTRIKQSYDYLVQT